MKTRAKHFTNRGKGPDELIQIQNEFIELPFVPDQPQDQQVQTEDPKDVAIAEFHKLLPHTLTFLKERSSDDPPTLVTRLDIYLDSSDTRPCYLPYRCIATVDTHACSAESVRSLGGP